MGLVEEILKRAKSMKTYVEEEAVVGGKRMVIRRLLTHSYDTRRARNIHPNYDWIYCDGNPEITTLD